MYRVARVSEHIDAEMSKNIEVILKLKRVLRRHAEAYEYIKTADSKQKVTSLLGNKKKTRFYVANDSYNDNQP